jgi:tetrahydromethanopterin S-methyltransferase subunit F
MGKLWDAYKQGFVDSCDTFKLIIRSLVGVSGAGVFGFMTGCVLAICLLLAVILVIIWIL